VTPRKLVSQAGTLERATVREGRKKASHVKLCTQGRRSRQADRQGYNKPSVRYVKQRKLASQAGSREGNRQGEKKPVTSRRQTGIQQAVSQIREAKEAS
jgi:hypothetical protein